MTETDNLYYQFYKPRNTPTENSHRTLKTRTPNPDTHHRTIPGAASTVKKTAPAKPTPK